MVHSQVCPKVTHLLEMQQMKANYYLIFFMERISSCAISAFVLLHANMKTFVHNIEFNFKHCHWSIWCLAKLLPSIFFHFITQLSFDMSFTVEFAALMWYSSSRPHTMEFGLFEKFINAWVKTNVDFTVVLTLQVFTWAFEKSF